MASFQSPAAAFDAVTVEVAGLTQKQIVSEAKRLHGEIMRTPPVPVSFKRHVDGVEAREEAVKLGGVIVYDYSRLDLVAEVALEILRELSPFKEGTYRDGHRIVVNRPTEIQITNTVPYARVIELGTRGQTKLRIQKGGHVYEKAARKLRGIPEIANSAKVKFTFTDAGSSGGNSPSARRAASYPTLIITAL